MSSVAAHVSLARASSFDKSSNVVVVVAAATYGVDVDAVDVVAAGIGLVLPAVVLLRVVLLNKIVLVTVKGQVCPVLGSMAWQVQVFAR